MNAEVQKGNGTPLEPKTYETIGLLVSVCGVIGPRICFNLFFPEWPIPYFLVAGIPAFAAHRPHKQESDGFSIFACILKAFLALTVALIITE